MTVISNILKDKLARRKEKEELFNLLQLISFIRTLESRVYNVADWKFIIVEFYLQNYFDYINLESIHQYQRQKLVQFLRDLTNITKLVNNFSDPSFRSIALFPKVQLTKSHSAWFIKLVPSSELYPFDYPFGLPKEFLLYKGKYDIETKLALLQAICVNNSKKEFLLDEFINEYSISNQKKTYLKQTLISLIEIVIKKKVIQRNLTFYNKESIPISIELTRNFILL